MVSREKDYLRHCKIYEFDSAPGHHFSVVLLKSLPLQNIVEECGLAYRLKPQFWGVFCLNG